MSFLKAKIILIFSENQLVIIMAHHLGEYVGKLFQASKSRKSKKAKIILIIYFLLWILFQSVPWWRFQFGMILLLFSEIILIIYFLVLYFFVVIIASVWHLRWGRDSSRGEGKTMVPYKVGLHLEDHPRTRIRG